MFEQHRILTNQVFIYSSSLAMLSRWTRLPLRRAIHTSAPRSRTHNRLPLALALTAFPATYLAYRLTSDSPLALDSTPNLSRLSHCPEYYLRQV